MPNLFKSFYSVFIRHSHPLLTSTVKIISWVGMRINSIGFLVHQTRWERKWNYLHGKADAGFPLETERENCEQKIHKYFRSCHWRPRYYIHGKFCRLRGSFCFEEYYNDSRFFYVTCCSPLITYNIIKMYFRGRGQMRKPSKLICYTDLKK